MSRRKKRQKGNSSKARKSSKPIKSSESSKSSKPSESSKPSKAKEGSDESGQKTIASQLHDLGLAEHHVKEDGNCMFVSIARHLDEMNHQVLRQAACDYLHNHREDYRQWAGDDFDKQLNDLRQDGEYANNLGDIVPIVIHDITKRDIVIIQDGQNPISFQLEANVTNSPIVIVRRGIHYNSTKRPKSEPKNQEMLDMALNETTTDDGSGIGNKKKKEKKKTGTVKIGGLNVNSLINNIHLVEQLIDAANLDILVIGRSRLPHPMEEQHIPIPNFNYVRQDRHFAGQEADGGLIVYLRKQVIYFTTKSKWEWSESRIQFLEIAITRPKRFDLIAVHNQNQNHSQCVIDRMRYFLRRNANQNTPLMFVGSLNIDIQRLEGLAARHQFSVFHDEFNTRVLITEPTYQRDNGPERCIDHIITNIPEEDMEDIVPNVINADILPHRLVLCGVKPGNTDCKPGGEIENNPRFIGSLHKRQTGEQVGLFEWLERLAETQAVASLSAQVVGNAMQCTIRVDVGANPNVPGIDVIRLQCSDEYFVAAGNEIPHRFYLCKRIDCLQLFNTKENLKHHETTHGTCAYCSYKTGNLQLLEVHRVNNHPHVCSNRHCMMWFGNRDEQSVHFRNTHFLCTDCPELNGFPTKNALRDHTRGHNA